jgi:Bcr/CflA subfamily drug resistance transporter
MIYLKVNKMKTIPKLTWLFPILLVVYEISVYLSNDMYLPALPNMMHDLQISATQAQLTITMWFIGAASTPLVMGALADHFGRRSTLLTGGMIYVFATIICALAVNESTILIPRIIQGAMISSMMVAGYACIHESYEHKEAIRLLAIMGGVSVLAPALGPLLGAIVLSFASWRFIFWIIGLLSTIMLISLYYNMPETLFPERRQALNLGTIMNNYWLVITNKKFIVLMAVLGCTFAGFISWIAAGPLLVIESLKYNAVAFGWMQALVFGAYIFGSHLVNFLLKTHDAHRLITLGLSVSLISGICLLLFSVLLPTQFYLFLSAIIFYSFGSALCFAPLNRLIIESTDQPMGIRVAMFTAGLMLCGVLGSSMASIIYNGTLFSLAIIIAVGIVMACVRRQLEFPTSDAV